VKSVLPILLLAGLALALAGGVILLVQGTSTLAFVLLGVGLTVAIGIVVRVGGPGNLGGLDERELSAAIHERAQRNLESARDRSKGA